MASSVLKQQTSQTDVFQDGLTIEPPIINTAKFSTLTIPRSEHRQERQRHCGKRAGQAHRPSRRTVATQPRKHIGGFYLPLDDPYGGEHPLLVASRSAEETEMLKQEKLREEEAIRVRDVAIADDKSMQRRFFYCAGLAVHLLDEEIRSFFVDQFLREYLELLHTLHTINREHVQIVTRQVQHHNFCNAVADLKSLPSFPSLEKQMSANVFASPSFKSKGFVGNFAVHMSMSPFWTVRDNANMTLIPNILRDIPHRG
ncbi:hypothetical protein EDC01DRAFT_630687 [Geopyxis carbonaria]|nr:hypothetical protein EDC01DRAFT_630687 [Geopyxis carbonaria]